MNKTYKLRYLPLFYNDIEKVLLYITNNLGNQMAAIDLLKNVETSILKRLPIAEAFEPYNSKQERKYKYYRIYVKNYIIYYVVINEADQKIMEVRRFLYNKQDAFNLL